MIKLLINEQEVKFELTKFPDGTSQVWKLQDDIDFDEYADTASLVSHSCCDRRSGRARLVKYIYE
jgi:hypothetical protein